MKVYVVQQYICYAKDTSYIDSIWTDKQKALARMDSLNMSTCKELEEYDCDRKNMIVIE